MLISVVAHPATGAGHPRGLQQRCQKTNRFAMRFALLSAERILKICAGRGKNYRHAKRLTARWGGHASGASAALAAAASRCRQEARIAACGRRAWLGARAAITVAAAPPAGAQRSRR